MWSVLWEMKDLENLFIYLVHKRFVHFLFIYFTRDSYIFLFYSQHYSKSHEFCVSLVTHIFTFWLTFFAFWLTLSLFDMNHNFCFLPHTFTLWHDPHFCFLTQLTVNYSLHDHVSNCYKDSVTLQFSNFRTVKCTWSGSTYQSSLSTLNQSEFSDCPGML